MMRSCEYSKTSYKEESKRTKILEINNFRFFKGNRQLDILKDTDDLKHADYVDINFILQKNNKVDDSVGLYDSEDVWRSPTFIWGTIIETILGYPGTDLNSPVNTWFDPKKKKLVYINSKQICTQLRASAHAIGSDKLGFSPDKIRCHSIRSGGAMALYLSNPNELIIMLIGRWKSNSFTKYIRKQVAMFSKNISKGMMKNRDFFTILDINKARKDRNKIDGDGSESNRIGIFPSHGFLARPPVFTMR